MQRSLSHTRLAFAAFALAVVCCGPSLAQIGLYTYPLDAARLPMLVQSEDPTAAEVSRMGDLAISVDFGNRGFISGDQVATERLQAIVDRLAPFRRRLGVLPHAVLVDYRRAQQTDPKMAQFRGNVFAFASAIVADAEFVVNHKNDELAGVIAHEIGHIDLCHWDAEGHQADTGTWVDRFTDWCLKPQETMPQERAADAYAVRLAILAGYDPYAMALYFDREGGTSDPRVAQHWLQSAWREFGLTDAQRQRLVELGGRTDLRYDHPPGAERAAAVRAQIEGPDPLLWGTSASSPIGHLPPHFEDVATTRATPSGQLRKGDWTGTAVRYGGGGPPGVAPSGEATLTVSEAGANDIHAKLALPALASPTRSELVIDLTARSVGTGRYELTGAGVSGKLELSRDEGGAGGYLAWAGGGRVGPRLLAPPSPNLGSHVLGVWDTTGKDAEGTEWTGTLKFESERPQIEVRGHINWRASNGTTGREDFIGTLDPTNGDLALQGASVDTQQLGRPGQQHLVAAAYAGSLTADRRRIVDGTWGDPPGGQNSVVPGTWCATRRGQPEPEPSPAGPAGVWDTTANDAEGTEWTGTLEFESERPQIEVRGHINWRASNGTTGREDFIGTLDPTNGDLALQGASVDTQQLGRPGQQHLVAAAYAGSLTADRRRIVDGTWGDPPGAQNSVVPGTWSATRRGQPGPEP